MDERFYPITVANFTVFVKNRYRKRSRKKLKSLDLLKTISSHRSERDIKAFTNLIKERIQPFNIAGLLDPASKNMYHHTVAEL